MIHAKPQSHQTLLDINGEIIQVMVHYQKKDNAINIVTMHDLDGNIISIYDFDESIEQSLVLELMQVKNNIYDYKIGEHVMVMAFDVSSENIVIGHDQKTNQVRLQPIDGMGSSYWGLEKLKQHRKRFDEYKVKTL